METELILFGVLPLNEAKRIQTELHQINLKTELKTNSQTCTTGCTVTVELWIEDDREAIQAFMINENNRDLGGLEINTELLAQVFDPAQEIAKCQACGQDFSTQATECPSCGLMYL